MLYKNEFLKIHFPRTSKCWVLQEYIFTRTLYGLFNGLMWIFQEYFLKDLTYIVQGYYMDFWPHMDFLGPNINHSSKNLLLRKFFRTSNGFYMVFSKIYIFMNLIWLFQGLSMDFSRIFFKDFIFWFILGIKSMVLNIFFMDFLLSL